jgi:hypothetical protein
MIFSMLGLKPSTSRLKSEILNQITSRKIDRSLLSLSYIVGSLIVCNFNLFLCFGHGLPFTLEAK